MYAWFSLTSSSSEDTFNRVQAWSCLESERAKAHAAACSALFVSFLAYGHSHLHWKLGSERHRACWPSLPQPCSAADRPGLLWHPIRSAWAEFLSVSPTGPPLRIWLQAYQLTFLTAGSFGGKACPSATLPASLNSFSLLFLLFDSFPSPTIGWLFPESEYLSLPATKCKNLLTFLRSVLLGRTLGSAASKLQLQMGWES